MFGSLVFPLGMYAVASLHLSLAADFPPLSAISHTMVWIALAAWAVTFTAFIRAFGRSFLSFGQA